MQPVHCIPAERLPGLAAIVQAQQQQRKNGSIDPIGVEFHSYLGTSCGSPQCLIRFARLSSSADELVLEAAANGQAAIVTFNRWDFGAAPASFGIELLTPAEAIRRIKK